MAELSPILLFVLVPSSLLDAFKVIVYQLVLVRHLGSLQADRLGRRGEFAKDCIEAGLLVIGLLHLTLVVAITAPLSLNSLIIRLPGEERTRFLLF